MRKNCDHCGKTCQPQMSKRQEERSRIDNSQDEKNKTNDNHVEKKEIEKIDDSEKNIPDITTEALNNFEQFKISPTAENEYKTSIETLIMLLKSQFIDKSVYLYEDAMELIDCLQMDNPQEDPTDTLLKTFSAYEPFSFVIPVIREYNGFGIHSDEKCIEVLKELQKELKGKVDDNLFPPLIEFVSRVDPVPAPKEIFTISSTFDKLEGYKPMSKMLECIDYMTDLIQSDDEEE